MSGVQMSHDSAFHNYTYNTNVLSNTVKSFIVWV